MPLIFFYNPEDDSLDLYIASRFKNALQCDSKRADAGHGH